MIIQQVILQRAFEKAKGLGLAVFNQMLANHLAELDCLDDTVLASFGQLEAGAPELNRKMLEVFEVREPYQRNSQENPIYGSLQGFPRVIAGVSVESPLGKP